MSMTDAEKRKAPEADDAPKAEAASTETPKIAVAVKPAATEEPAAKRPKTAPEAAVVRKQIEYYLSDDNLKHDKFFHDKISDKDNAEGWLSIDVILSCNKMKVLGATKDDVVASLKDSKIEIKEDKLSVRRPGNLALPPLEAKIQHQKKSQAHAHDGGILALIKGIPAEQSWMQLKEKLRSKLPDKVNIWFVSEVTDKNTCTVSCSPFNDDAQFFEELQLEVGGTKVTAEVVQGDALQQALKVLPKHIRDKREKEARKRQKERNRPIVVGSQRFVNIAALRGRVKEILNSRSDGETLKPDGSDYKLIKAILGFHPKGEEKSKGMVGLKVNTSKQGGNRCFWMIREDGKEDDFSAVKCLSAIEANPPYVEVEKKEESAVKAAASPAIAEKKEESATPAEKKEDAAPAEKKDAEMKEAPAAEKKDEAAPAEKAAATA